MPLWHSGHCDVDARQRGFQQF